MKKKSKSSCAIAFAFACAFAFAFFITKKVIILRQKSEFLDKSNNYYLYSK
jgi:hypothetical protein